MKHSKWYKCCIDNGLLPIYDEVKIVPGLSYEKSKQLSVHSFESNYSIEENKWGFTESKIVITTFVDKVRKVAPAGGMVDIRVFNIVTSNIGKPVLCFNTERINTEKMFKQMLDNALTTIKNYEIQLKIYKIKNICKDIE